MKVKLKLLFEKFETKRFLLNGKLSSVVRKSNLQKPVHEPVLSGERRLNNSTQPRSGVLQCVVLAS